MIKKADLIMAIAVLSVFLIVIGAFFLFGRPGGRAVVTSNGEVVATLPLNNDGEYTCSGDLGTNKIVVKDGEVFVESADCRDQICVNHIAVSKEGEIIVCLPHKLIVEVKK